MKYYSIIFVFLILVSACNSGTKVKQEQSEDKISSNGIFGQEFEAENAIDATQLSSLFKESNKVEVMLVRQVVECCQHSGCWMDLDIGNGEIMQVLFKDGDFTIPIESAGKTAIISGIAYREQLEVAELKAMAKDDGKSEAEINLIIEPSWEYSFVADGVIFQ